MLNLVMDSRLRRWPGRTSAGPASSRRVHRPRSPAADARAFELPCSAQHAALTGKLLDERSRKKAAQTHNLADVDKTVQTCLGPAVAGEPSGPAAQLPLRRDDRPSSPAGRSRSTSLGQGWPGSPPTSRRRAESVHANLPAFRSSARSTPVTPGSASASDSGFRRRARPPRCCCRRDP